jgi:hypothetical protein
MQGDFACGQSAKAIKGERSAIGEKTAVAFPGEKISYSIAQTGRQPLFINLIFTKTFE